MMGIFRLQSITSLGDLELVEELLSHGAVVDFPRGIYESQITLLGAAVQSHDIRFVKKLLTKYNAHPCLIKRNLIELFSKR